MFNEIEVLSLPSATALSIWRRACLLFQCIAMVRSSKVDRRHESGISIHLGEQNLDSLRFTA